MDTNFTTTIRLDMHVDYIILDLEAVAMVWLQQSEQLLLHGHLSETLRFHLADTGSALKTFRKVMSNDPWYPPSFNVLHLEWHRRYRYLTRKQHIIRLGARGQSAI